MFDDELVLVVFLDGQCFLVGKRKVLVHHPGERPDQDDDHEERRYMVRLIDGYDRHDQGDERDGEQDGDPVHLEKRQKLVHGASFLVGWDSNVNCQS